ncbi:MAG: HD domain-containing protein [Cytophagales bacterium]|nr:HD domain-containing protein [Cytophagales bacterium]
MIINDPVYGFITIKSKLIFEIIEHPFFQRLRRIQQLGLTGFVYPGALHTRFHHAIGAMHLMGLALDSLRSKGHEISDQEYEAAQLAILLHDIGHGPLSHTLESSILTDIPHEKISLVFINYFNLQFNGKLDLVIKIFNDKYERRFFHQLVASQLDIDRLDYLKRDCYYTGVPEGSISEERIIKMLNLVNDELVVEEKGIYSIENFLNARRLMYWQVYLHKTVISTEQMVISILKRAKSIFHQTSSIKHLPSFLPSLSFFLNQNIGVVDFQQDPNCLKQFALLDDHDIWSAIKLWVNSEDNVLSTISKNLLERKLFKVELTNHPCTKSHLQSIQSKICKEFDVSDKDINYFVIHGSLSNSAYISKGLSASEEGKFFKNKGKLRQAGETINILMKNGEIVDVAQAADLPNIKAMSKIVKKYYVCYPKIVKQ